MMMTRYCTISHRLDGLLPDTAGNDDEVTGHVIFTPVLSRGDAYTVDNLDGEGPATIVAAPVTARIVNGELEHNGEQGVQLFAGGPGSNPEVVRWKAAFHNLKINLAKAELRDIIFDAVPGGTINLAEVQPPAGAPPVGIMRGEKGDKGDPFTFEDLTPEQVAALLPAPIETPPGSGLYTIGGTP